MTNKANQYPEEKDEVRLVGEVEYFVSTEISTTQGTFKLTQNMLDDLWKLKAQSERIGRPQPTTPFPYRLVMSAFVDLDEYKEKKQEEKKQEETECLDTAYRLGVERQKREFRRDVIRVIMNSVVALVISAGFLTFICYVFAG